MVKISLGDAENRLNKVIEENPKDEIGRKHPGHNPIKLKNSTLFERDQYMNCPGATPE